MSSTFISDLKITLGAAGTVANSLATPIYQYERLVLKYLFNIRCIYWISFKYCYSKHLGLSQYTQGACISSQCHEQGTWNSDIIPIKNLLNSGKNFGQVHFYTWVNLLQWKSVFVGSQFLQQHQKLLLRILSWNFSHENCFQFIQNFPELLSSVSNFFSTKDGPVFVGAPTPSNNEGSGDLEEIFHPRVVCCQAKSGLALRTIRNVIMCQSGSCQKD